MYENIWIHNGPTENSTTLQRIFLILIKIGKFNNHEKSIKIFLPHYTNFSKLSLKSILSRKTVLENILHSHEISKFIFFTNCLQNFSKIPRKNGWKSLLCVFRATKYLADLWLIPKPYIKVIRQQLDRNILSSTCAFVNL